MSDEIIVRTAVTVNKTPLYYQSRPTVFTEDLTYARRESVPFTATPAGVAISFSHLTHPGRCVIYNFSSTAKLILGIYDGASFYPLIDILPENYETIRLTRYLNQEFTPGTGTGTGSDINQLMIKSEGDTPTDYADGVVDAFEYD